MSQTVSFKVYMTKKEDPSVKEVRRFGIEVDVVTNFLYLREKIQSIFSALRGKHFTIFWKDSDGDDVSISSDEELGIALTETASSTVRKLYVVLHSEYAKSDSPYAHGIFVQSQAKSSSANPGPVHVGITCDGCDGQVYGSRYKCIQCPDYDLCTSCESKGLHPEHCMIRMTIPLQWKSHAGKRLANTINKFARRAHIPKAAGEEDLKAGCPFKSGKHSGKSRHGSEDISWLDTFTTYLDEWANLPGECPAKAPQQAAKEEPEVPKTKPNVAENKCPMSNGSNSSDQIKLLKDVVGLVAGENFLAQFLDPLINAPANNAGKPEAASTSADNTPTSSPPSSSASVNGEKITAENGNSAVTKDAKETVKVDNTATAINNDASPSVEPKQSGENGSELEWTLINENDSSISSHNSGVSVSTGAVPKQVQPSAPIEATSSKPIYPVLPKEKVAEPTEIYHQNPNIQKAVESMIQMGFSNNGGWLTNLLVSKSGDIAAALDALSPARR